MAEKTTYRKIRKFVDGLTNSTDKAGELYKSLFEDSHSVMLIIHPDNGVIIDANRAACSFYQYTKETITNMSIMDINNLPAERIHKEMQHAKTEQRNYFKFQHKLSNGEIRDVEVYSSPIVLGEQKVLYSIVHDITARLRIEREREEVIAQLKKAQDEIKILKGILPLCSFCKKIRDTKGNWVQVDVYIYRHSEADISHTVCPECRKKHYPEYGKKWKWYRSFRQTR